MINAWKNNHGRAPQGARGLKCIYDKRLEEQSRSRPARGAWVEISVDSDIASGASGRAPQGARGLKYSNRDFKSMPSESRPARGAWVEIDV